MSPSRDFLVTILALCVLVLGIVVWRQQQALARLAGPRPAALGPGAESLRVGAEIAEPAGLGRMAPWPLRARRSEPTAAGPAPHLAVVIAMMEDPGFLRAVGSQQRSLLDARFGELFGQLELTAEELDELRALLIEKQNAAMDVLLVSRGELAGGMTGGELRQATRRAQAEIDAMIRQTLGEARYARFKAYETTLPQRAAVTQLERRLSYTPDPLEPAQAEALVAMMVEAGGEVRPARPGVSVVVDPKERQAVPVVQGVAESVEITEAVMAGAAGVLRPRQLMALQELRQEQAAAARVVELARRWLPDTSAGSFDGLDGLEVQLLLQ